MNCIFSFVAVVAVALGTSGALAFQSAHTVARPLVQCQMSTMTNDPLLLRQRDVAPLGDWCRGYGTQTAPGVEIVSSDGENYGLQTREAIPKGGPVLFVPAQLVLSSSAIQQEFAGRLDASEQLLVQRGASDRLPLFRLLVKILVEYEKGTQSPYFAWLNALPRIFYNGVSMTDACFECLPPYVSYLAAQERTNYGYFYEALNGGNVPLSPETTSNDEIVRWAYNVALTRHQVVVPEVEKKITPFADLLNHGTFANTKITYDADGNCHVTATRDINAQAELTISLGDASNPSPLFAKYGFLDNDCPGVFCKALSHQNEMQELGYDFTDLLFGTDTGEIGTRVWNLFLYKLLKDNQDPNADVLRSAVWNKNAGTITQLNQQYFQYTQQALVQHVDSTIGLIDQLTAKANTYDVRTHPRVPVIVAHNNLVRDTLVKVQAQLYGMMR